MKMEWKGIGCGAQIQNSPNLLLVGMWLLMSLQFWVIERSNLM